MTERHRSWSADIGAIAVDAGLGGERSARADGMTERLSTRRPARGAAAAYRGTRPNQ
jgi:hypothetical protein